MAKLLLWMQLLLTLVVVAFAYRQRVVFHDTLSDEEQGNSFVFETHVPNNTFARSGKAVRFCIQGSWFFFYSSNYNNPHLGATESGSCYNRSYLNAWTSFRYHGASDTSSAALSLYSGLSYSGREIFVDGIAYGGITTHVNSLAMTGTSSWMLYEGTQFNGTSACAKPISEITAGVSLWSNIKSSFNLTTIGSVIRDCRTRSLNEIQVFRREWESSGNN